MDGSTTGVIPPTRELLTTALPPQRCGGLDLRNGGWTFSTFCSHGQMLFRNIRRFTATFALDMLSAYGFRTVVSLREKTTASNSSVLEHPARLFFFYKRSVKKGRLACALARRVSPALDASAVTREASSHALGRLPALQVGGPSQLRMPAASHCYLLSRPLRGSSRVATAPEH